MDHEQLAALIDGKATEVLSGRHARAMALELIESLSPEDRATALDLLLTAEILDRAGERLRGGG